MTLLGASGHGFACDPAVMSLDELIANPSVAVVGGRFYRAPHQDDPNNAIFLVTRVLRGDVGHGEFTVAEGGAFGSSCEYAEMAVGMHEDVADSKHTDDYLFVTRYDNKHNFLIVPLGWGQGAIRGNHKRLNLREICDIGIDRFEAAVRDLAPSIATLCPSSAP